MVRDQNDGSGLLDFFPRIRFGAKDTPQNDTGILLKVLLTTIIHTAVVGHRHDLANLAG